MEVTAKPNVGEVTMRLLSINLRRISKARSLEAGTHTKRSVGVARLAQEEFGRSQGTPHKVLFRGGGVLHQAIISYCTSNLNPH